MRIWLISSSYPRWPGESMNAGVFARDIALGLAAAGHDVRVLTPEKPGGVVFDAEFSGTTIPWLSPSLQISDITRRPRDMVRAGSLLASARWTIRKEARRQRPDGVIALWGIPSGIFARWTARESDSRYVVWLLGSDVWRASQIPFGVTTLSSVVRGAAAVFADGIQLARDAEELTGTPVEFLPSVRRLPRFSGEDLPPIDVLFVGRYHRNKGPDVLIDALKILHDQGLEIRAEMYGAGDLEEDLKRRVRNGGLAEIVQVNPPIDPHPLADRLATARLLVIPSRIESLPLILGDAVQSRTRVLATRVGDMGDVVEALGLGTTIEPDNPRALASAIEKALDDRSFEADWSAAELLFSPASAQQRLLDVLQAP